jgi:hypothetical protein
MGAYLLCIQPPPGHHSSHAPLYLSLGPAAAPLAQGVALGRAQSAASLAPACASHQHEPPSALECELRLSIHTETQRCMVFNTQM